jgi:hypothetical protein
MTRGNSGCMPSTHRRSTAWLVLGAALISALYLPTLTTRFDFIDDGNLVYPSMPMPVSNRVELYWTKVMANYRGLGPFRPVLWAHWEAQAELLGANAMRWRAARLIWTWLAAAAMLELLLELGITPEAALFTVAVAMWAPKRDEIWTSLTLAEGVAMPYAMLALIFALRAARSNRALKWDLGGGICILAIVLCKNTFAAMVPAQMLLRIWPDGQSWREGWRLRGVRAMPLALTLIVPVAHFLIFKAGWHEGQYRVGAPSPERAAGIARVIWNAAGAPYLAAGVVLAVVAIATRADPLRPSALTPIWRRHRGALIAGLLLLLCGAAIYLPVNGGTSGHYAIPAVWGIDLCLGALLSEFFQLPRGRWKTIAATALVAGLTGIAIANLAHQQKFAARAECLWEALEVVERSAPPGACIGWSFGPKLNIEEGVHFAWHLRGRGEDLKFAFFDEHGASEGRREIPIAKRCAAPDFLITATSLPFDPGFELVSHVATPYHFGTRHFDCYVWRRLR